MGRGANLGLFRPRGPATPALQGPSKNCNDPVQALPERREAASPGSFTSPATDRSTQASTSP